ncbi:hypothetical protein NQL31_001516 [Lotmaria passim]
MSINGSGAILMEPMPNSRRPGPPMDPHNVYPRPTSSSSNQCHLPPVQQGQPPNNGIWRGGYMRSRPPVSPPPMVMLDTTGKVNVPLPLAPHPPPPSMNYKAPGPRPMRKGMPPQPLGPVISSAGIARPGQRPPSGPSSPIMPPASTVNLSTGMASAAVNVSHNMGPQQHEQYDMQRPPLAPPRLPQPPPQKQQLRRDPRVRSVARGPQPTCVEPTRLRDGRKIKDVQCQQRRQSGDQDHSQGEAHHRPHRFTGPGKNDPGPNKNGSPNHMDNHEPKRVKTTVGNDESWVKGLTYSTWIDSPRGNLNDLDSKDGPYKRQAAHGSRQHRRKPHKKTSSTSSNSGGLLEMLRNLFR